MTKQKKPIEVGGRRVLRPKQMWVKVGVSPATGWRKVKRDPRFPKPIRIGPMILGFIEEEADAYLDSLIAERDGRSGEGGMSAKDPNLDGLTDEDLAELDQLLGEQLSKKQRARRRKTPRPLPGTIRFDIDDDRQSPGYHLEGDDLILHLSPDDAFVMVGRLVAMLAAADGRTVTAPGLRALARLAERGGAVA